MHHESSPDSPRRPRRRRSAIGAGALVAVAATAALAAPISSLDFSAPVAGTVADKDDNGTGFGEVLPNTAGSQYVKANLDLGPGTLVVTSTPGDFTGPDQQNALAVPFDGTGGKYTATARIDGPLPLVDQPFEGVGIFVGTGQDTYAKLAIGRVQNFGAPGTSLTQVQFGSEDGANNAPGELGSKFNVAGAVTRNEANTVGDFFDLKLSVDAAGAVTGSYTEAPSGFVQSFGPVTLPFVVGPGVRAGIVTTSKQGPQGPTAPIPFTFDSFLLDKEGAVAPPAPGGGTTTAGQCVSVPPRVAGKAGKVKLSVGAIRVEQRISSAVVRRLNAIEKWLGDGIVTGDLCGGGIAAADLAADVKTGPVAASANPSILAAPRPVVIAASTGKKGTIKFTRAQLITNRRIALAALARATSLEKRLTQLTGGDFRAGGQITAGKLAPGLAITTAGTSPTQPKSVTPAAGKITPGTVAFTVAQMKKNQATASAAVRKANAILDQLSSGLTGVNFANGSISGNEISSAAKP